MKSLLAILISSALVVSGYSQTRNVLVNSNNAVVSPTNFWSADTSNARTGLGLGTAATNPASAFQPSSGVLSNLASSNAVNLTNLRASNVVGVLSLERGGTGATNALAARTALGLGTASTNAESAFQPSSATLSNLASSNAVNLTNLRATNIVGTIPASNIPSLSITNISGTLAISNGGTGATNAATARTNLGFGAGSTNEIGFGTVRMSGFGINFIETVDEEIVIGLPSDTDPVYLNPIHWDDTNVRTSLGLGVTNNVRFNSVQLFLSGETTNSITYWIDGLSFVTGGVEYFATDAGDGGIVRFEKPITMFNSTNRAITRTNLGLGWSALTNTNTAGFNTSLYGSNTNPVLVNTSGTVVSPTNFWQVAPILTLVQDFTGVVINQTNNITNARSVYVYSLATNVGSVSNTLLLPTNAATFAGDEVTVIHRGTTNTTTVIRQAGSTNNLITLSRFDESVKFIRELGQWDFYHNISFVEPVQFSGTNAVANAAASRTNLGLGQFKDAIGDNWAELYDNGELRMQAGNTIIFYESFDFGGTNAADFREQSRISLGLGATNNVTFSNVVASGTLTATSTVTAKTNLVVEGFVNFTTNHTNAVPATPNTPARWLQIRVGTNVFYLPAHQ